MKYFTIMLLICNGLVFIWSDYDIVSYLRSSGILDDSVDDKYAELIKYVVQDVNANPAKD
jgi:serine/threonine protein phosphatase PrpC